MFLQLNLLPIFLFAALQQPQKSENSQTLATMKISRFAATGAGRLGIQSNSKSPILRSFSFLEFCHCLTRLIAPWKSPTPWVLPLLVPDSVLTLHNNPVPWGLSKTISGNCSTSQLLKSARTVGVKKKLTKKLIKIMQGKKMFMEEFEKQCGKPMHMQSCVHAQETPERKPVSHPWLTLKLCKSRMCRLGNQLAEY